MTSDIPVGARFESQSQTDLPVNSDNTIMDDTVMTMDGDGLMGGQVTLQPPMRQTVEISRPQARLKVRR